MSFTYPTFPAYNGNIGTMILQIIIWIIEIPLIAIGNVIVDVFGGIGVSAESTVGTIVSFPGAIFEQTVNSFHEFGVFAPIIASLIWGVSIIILIFFIFKAIQLAGDEMTNEE